MTIRPVWPANFASLADCFVALLGIRRQAQVLRGICRVDGNVESPTLARHGFDRVLLGVVGHVLVPSAEKVLYLQCLDDCVLRAAWVCEAHVTPEGSRGQHEHDHVK